MAASREEAPLSRPVWINCDSIADVGSSEELGMRAKPGNHVVLRFRALAENERTLLIDRLSKALPDHSVFTSGEMQITIASVVSKARILERRVEAIRAVELYREACLQLMGRRESGGLSPAWSAHEHGDHCRFENRRTGQVVEAPLPGASDPDDVDPYFFSEFVKTTAGLEAVAELIRNKFHDGARILDVIERGA